MLWPLLVTSALAAQSSVVKIKDLARDGKHDKAVAQCEKLLTKTPDDQPLREACGDAAWRLVDETSQPALDTFALLWTDTTAGRRAHRDAGALALEEAGDQEDRLRDVVARYPETLAAKEGLRRLTHADFLAARDAGDARSMEMFLSLHPDASHAVMARNILHSRRFDEAAASDTVEAWQGFLDSWPEHPQFDEAQGRLADATFAEATTPGALYAFGLAWPEHPRAIEALEGALPVMIQLAHRDSDLEVATRTLDHLTLEAPDGVTLSLWVADLPAADVCADAPELTWIEGELRYPFGACMRDSDPIRYVIRASAGPAFLDFDLWVRQAHQDPTLDLALRFGSVGQLKAGCATPNTCSPRSLVFDDQGGVLAGVQGPPGDSEVAWWPLPADAERLDAPVEAAGHWRGPLASIAAVGLSPDGGRLAVGYCSESLASLYLVDLVSDRLLGTRDGLCAQDLKFAPGARALAVVTSDAVTVFDGQTAATRDELSSALTPQLAAWSADGERLIWWSQDDRQGQVVVWSGDAPVALDPVGAEDLLPRQTQVSSDGARACLLSESSYACWDTTTGRPLQRSDLAAVQVDSPGPIAMAADVDLIAVGLAKGGVALYDGRTAEQLLVLAGTTGPVTALAVSSDGTRIAATDSTGAVFLWGAR
jgi:hypothetical protein